jgi:GDSL-like Lipase/Acylhydrolase family
MHKILFPMLTLVMSLIVVGLLAELLVRLVADDGKQFDLEMWKYARDVKIVSPDPLIGHEHRPNRKAHLMGVDVVTNSQGLRDREFQYDRRQGVLRIVMLGDSVTLGWGVPYEVTFSKRLERLYAKRGINAEVINTAVGNWNTVQEVQYFLTNAYRYHPDVVVLNYFVNDAEVVGTDWPMSLLMRHCYVCVFLAGRFDVALRQFSVRQNWRDYYLSLYDGGSKPGWVAAKTAIKNLAEYCNTNGIALVIANIPELHDIERYQFAAVTDLVRETARESDIQFIDLLPALRGHKSSELWVTGSDPHPNALAHQLIAAGLYDACAACVARSTVSVSR